MSTHILTVQLTVNNSAWQKLQTIDLDVAQLPETHPLIIELRKAWDELVAMDLAAAQRNNGDLFALG